MGINWRGAWSSSVIYTARDAVFYDGSSWVALLDNTNIPPAEGDEWSLIARKGDAGPQGLKGDKGDQGIQGPKGDKGDRGAAGQSVIGAAEPAGSNCAYGGLKYTDVTGVRYVCNGAPGPQGPAGNTNTFPSAHAYTIPIGGKLTVTDAHVTADSVIVLQYVGGGPIPPLLLSTGAGQFTAAGAPTRQFRYVVFN